MKIKTELLKRHISDYITNQIDNFEIDADEIADSRAIQILSEIQEILKSENYNDFETVEEIIRIFENNKLDSGFRHNF